MLLLRRHQVLAVFVAAMLTIAAPVVSPAQIVAPSQSTPQSLRPSFDTQGPAIALSGQAAAPAASGNDSLSVLLRDVQIDGSFAELADAADAAAASLRGRQVTVAQIYAVARTLERSYAQAGYPLVRVVIPPQKLLSDGNLQIIVVDGFVEDVDVSAVPDRVRSVVASRVEYLVGRRHVRLTDIERALLLAGDLPGLKLKSTLMRGAVDGGTRLVLEGEHRLVTGAAGGDDRLASSLGTWQLRGSVAVNSALGLGEQVYGSVGLGANLAAVATGAAPLAVYGGGVVIPIGVEGITLNPEYTHSMTRTAQQPGVPASLGTFERFALRLHDPVVTTRAASLNVNASIEYVTQQIYAPAFGVSINQDAYLVARGGPDYSMTLPWGAGLQLGASLSQGLTGRTGADAIASGVPLSRAGAAPDFTKITGGLHFSQPLPADLRLDVIGLAQLSMGKPLLRSEQFVLDGSDAVSAFATGTLNADQGGTLRTEVARSFTARFDAADATVAPYVFAAIGRGQSFNVTLVEQSVVNAGALGFGARGGVAFAGNPSRLNFGLELARQFTDLAGVHQGWRGNVNAAVEF